SGTGSGTALGNLSGVAFDVDGGIIVSDTSVDAIFHVDPSTGDRTIISSNTDPGPAFVTLLAIATESDGNFVVLESDAPDALNRVDALTGARSLLSGSTRGSGPNFSELHDVIALPQAVENVPTMPEWGLFLLVGLLLAVGGLMQRSQRQIRL
ncbi:MAG: IPTL-CTERM sorting domain-containing protein, partial [Deltaproteobacteria bacterium]|nr:IPTL-CTERM sorting domain-containing protein [Deltaproteobacteria bacterium]